MLGLILDIIFIFFWGGLAIISFAGVEIPTITVGCGFILAALFNLRNAVDRKNRM